jgi:hypothetical protein
VEVAFTAACEDPPALSHLKEISPEACFQNWMRSVSGLQRFSTAEGQRFGQVVTEIVEQGRLLSPSPYRAA